MVKNNELKSGLTALHFSLVLHVLILLMFIIVKNPVAHRGDLMVIDFTMEQPVGRRPEAAGAVQPKRDRKFSNEKDIIIHRSVTEHPQSTPAPHAEPVKQNEQGKETPYFAGGEIDYYYRDRSSGDVQAVTDRPAGNGMGDSEGGGKTGSASSRFTAVESPDSVKKRYLKANFSYIRELIHKNIVYPESARRMGWEGKVIVSFIVTSHGFAKDIILVRSSGYAILDKHALQAVKDSTPFPRPPGEAQLIVPVLYRLN